MIDLDKLEELAKTATTGLPGDRIQFSLAAWDPAAILELIAEVQALRETIKRQANAARAGMDAAKRASTILYAEAAKARAESSPDVLASERAMNSILTEENEALRADAERYDFLSQRAELRQSDIGYYW